MEWNMVICPGMGIAGNKPGLFLNMYLNVFLTAAAAIPAGDPGGGDGRGGCLPAFLDTTWGTVQLQLHGERRLCVRECVCLC